MMKDRIMQIMKDADMSQQDFAAALEVSPSSLSSIFNGRTNPTSKHVSAIHRRFPKININWLMFGEGNMCDDTAASEEPERDLPEQDAENGAARNDSGDSGRKDQAALQGGGADNGSANECPEFSSHIGVAQIPVIRETVKYIDKPQRKITEIRIFFDDGTYETFKGKVD